MNDVDAMEKELYDICQQLNRIGSNHLEKAGRLVTYRSMNEMRPVIKDMLSRANELHETLYPDSIWIYGWNQRMGLYPKRKQGVPTSDAS